MKTALYPLTGPGKFQWNGVGWFGSTLGSSAWMLVTSCFLFANNQPLAALIAASGFFIILLASIVLWSFRGRVYPFSTLMAILGLMAITIPLVWQFVQTYASAESKNAMNWPDSPWSTAFVTMLCLAIMIRFVYLERLEKKKGSHQGLVLLLAAIGLLGCDYPVSSPGSYMQETDADYLLPDGMRWQYTVVLPDDVADSDSVELQIRRFLVEEEDKGIRGWGILPVEKAEEVWSGTRFRKLSPDDKIKVSLQLLDLHDYSPLPLAEYPFKLVGGISVAGQIDRIRCDPSFIIGKSAGCFPLESNAWSNNAICLLRFWTVIDDREFAYDICMRLLKAD